MKHVHSYILQSFLFMFLLDVGKEVWHFFSSFFYWNKLRILQLNLLLIGGNVTAAFLAQRSSEPTGPLVCLLIYILISFLLLVVNNRGVDNSLSGMFTEMSFLSQSEKLNRGASVCLSNSH